MAALSFYLVHGYALWSVWTFFGLLQIASNRYFKHHWQTNLWVHKISGAVITMSTLIYGIVGYVKLMFIKDDVHAPMGVTVTALIAVLGISGLAARYSLSNSTENQGRVLACKLFHKVSHFSCRVF